MTTKPCPQCGSAVPVQARFCGQCGRTFADAPGRSIPTTVDEATADPPPVQPAAPAPRPHAGAATVIGHSPVATPAAGLGRTVLDPAPYGATAGATAEANPETPGPKANDHGASARAAQVLGKTMMLGGVVPPPPAVAAPPAAADLPRAVETSPLSKSVFTPSTPPPGPAASSVQNAPNPAPPAVVPPPQQAPIASTPAALGATGSDKQTMLGMPATGLPVPSPQPSPQAIPPAFKTMLGVALPGIAPTHEKPAPEPARPPPERAGTLLGVAAPGIAPMHHVAPGPQHRPMQPPPDMRTPPAPPPPIVPAPAPLVVEPLPEAPQVPKKKGVPAIAVVAIVFVLVAIIGGGAALVVLRSGAPLTAQPQLDESGKESLKIRCESCPDGTIVSLGASSSKVEGAATILPLPAPLSIGDNDLEMKIDRPPPGRDETVKVHVPVAYRVKADLSTLTTAPAAITVRVEALAGTEVTVDGKPVALDGAGKGSQTIDVNGDVEGPSDEQKAIDKQIPFTIKPKGAAQAENGQLVVRTGVAPLHLDAPGIELYTERTTGNVAGQVKPGGTLTIDGQNVAVDAEGRFGVRVELPTEAEKTITIIATAPPLAPRTVRAKLVRVASLEAGAKALDAKSPIGFDTYAADPQSKLGQLVLVDGEIQEIRVAQGHTVMAIEEKKACSAGAGACLVRVVHGEEVKAARGDTIRVYGRALGTTTSNGKTIPDVEGTLALPKSAGKK